MKALACAGALLASSSYTAVRAQTETSQAKGMTPVELGIATPDSVQTRLGVLEFKDGVPSVETVQKIYDHLDFTHAFEAFVNTFQGVNMAAAHKGALSIGVKDNEVMVFSTLMD